MRSPFGLNFKNCTEEDYLTGRGAEDRAAGIDAQTLASVMRRARDCRVGSDHKRLTINILI